MFDDEKKRLQALSPFNRWLIVGYLHYLLWRQFVRKLPLPLKFGGAQSLALFAILALLPLHLHRPGLVLPVMWAGSLCIGFIVAASLPRRKGIP